MSSEEGKSVKESCTLEARRHELPVVSSSKAPRSRGHRILGNRARCPISIWRTRLMKSSAQASVVNVNYQPSLVDGILQYSIDGSLL